MTSSLLDTKYEAALRVVLMLDELDRSASTDELGALDTLVINARTLKVGVNDVNGPHRLAKGELVRRTALAEAALQLLAARALVTCQLGEPPTWELTDQGRVFADQLTTRYAYDFCESMHDVLVCVQDAPVHVLIRHVLEQAGDIR